MSIHSFRVCCILILAHFIFLRPATAASSCATQVARIVSVQGIVEIRRTNDAAWQPIVLNTEVCAGDTLRAGNHSRASLRLNNDSMLRIDQKTTLSFPATDDNQTISLIDLLKGAIHIITRTPKPFKVTTPFMNAAVEGTEFFVGVASDQTQLVIYEGRVSASNDQGSLVLNDHEAAVAYRNQPPHKEIIVKPLDAVQWALYYPAILDSQDNATSKNNIYLKNQRNELEKAAYLLSVGQANEANVVINRIFETDSNNSEAMALQSIIAVVQQDKALALALANQAANLDNFSVSARLALSYAQQSNFEIEDALESAKQAVAIDPQNALIWARLAELKMSIGELEAALEAAQQAVALNPEIAKTQTVLGFAYLLKINTSEAKSVLAQAILLDQADPMPRLGMGLALIRGGELEAGRIELEIAASLDPGNSLIRSYLGKAYFEENRYTLAETQFELAKEWDPFDPTPWFYDAIQKQTQNRPVEALMDIQKSIELNDNRAVYRSRLLLDQDQAGRGSSLARIYDNLGFEKRALMETAKSLSFDPSNHSAHRFLADTYANIPRHEAARVSELLQAQLMQPINVNPVQPHLAVADLNIITNTGPAAAGFNEFAPLMERNRSQFVVSGFGGNNSTFGNEIVFSKLYERTSVSLGQFHYQSDGFRTNNDQNHDILNAFIQHAVTPRFNIQTEVRTRRTDQGNLILDFDEDSDNLKLPKNRFRRKINEDSVRIGTRYDLSPNQKIILSGQYLNRKSENIDPSQSTDFLSNFETVAKNEGYQTEIQYQLLYDRFNLLAGSGTYRINVNQHQLNRNLNTHQIICCTSQNFSVDKTNGYIYSNFNLSYSLDTTIGFSYDFYQERGLTINRFNPKLGLQWDITSNLRLRFAWIDAVKAPLTTNQTIEPTQVAGFNQLFDDINGTKSRRIGIGLDAQSNNKVFAGFEISSRDLRVPIHVSDNNFTFQDQKEKLYRAYLYGLLHHNWAAKSEIKFEQFSRKETITGPHQIDTFSIPVGINYFNSQGIFANLTGTYVHQKVDRKGTENEGIENFFLLDASLGYRLPNRKGIFSLEAKNIFDQSFLFRNINFLPAEPINIRYMPTRTIFMRLTLNF